jgi:hypothetical protein
MKQYPQG